MSALRQHKRLKQKVSDKLCTLAMCFHAEIQQKEIEKGSDEFKMLKGMYNEKWLLYCKDLLLKHRFDANYKAFNEYLKLC